MRLLVLYALLFGTSLPATAAIPVSGRERVLFLSEEKHLASTRQWLKLLHFEKNSFGKIESQIDSDDFFFSPHGKTNAALELQATIEAFFRDPTIADSFLKAQCRFPARYRWLKSQMKAENIQWPDGACERFETFRNSVLGGGEQLSVSVVFSSYYLNNPSSAFGHTFLRINKAPQALDGKRYELLDYGVNYAANVDTNNALVYAIKGLFGMFPGRFTSVPYYFKVREYNNAESRDLWEYDLNLSPEAARMVVAHVWELGPTKIDYWYLSENCSYEIYTLLEAADPSVDLSAKLDRFVIPSDTVRVLWNKSNLVKAVHYRPSVRTQFENRLELLSPQEKMSLMTTIKEGEAEPQASTAVLDAYIDYLDYRFPKDVQDETTEAYQKKMKVLSLRATRSDGDLELYKVPGPEQSPHLAHASGRWGVGVGTSDKKSMFGTFNHRFALHDRLDPQWGYPEYSQISMMETDFSYSSSYQHPDDKKIELENFSIFEVKSLSSYTPFERNHSWQVKLGVERIKNENLPEQLAAVMRAGWGFTKEFRRLELTAQIIGEGNAAPELPENNEWAGIGLWTEAHYSFSSLWQMAVDLTYERQNLDIKDYWKGRVSTQWSPTKEYGFRLSYNNYRFDQEYQLQSFFYY